MVKKRDRVKLFNYASDVKDLLDIMQDGGVYTVDQLSDELNRTKERVRRIVKRARDKFNDGNKSVDYWVYSTRGGYTIEEKPEHAMHETRMRMRMGMGVILNGAHVFRTAKRIAARDFGAFQIEHKPKMLTMGRLIK